MFDRDLEALGDARRPCESVFPSRVGKKTLERFLSRSATYNIDEVDRIAVPDRWNRAISPRVPRSVMPQSPECLFLLGPQMTALPTALIGEFIDAAVQNPVRAADLLTAHPELINARWLHDETVLHFLAIEGYSQAVQFLAEHGADVNAANEFGDSPLVDVVVLGRADIVDLLLRHGANPNARSETRDSVLHCAVQSGNDEIVALLLAAGADARYRNDLDESVLDVLPAYGDERERMLAALAKYGITPEPE
jgi:Ankyrin repeats (3 copies)